SLRAMTVAKIACPCARRNHPRSKMLLTNIGGFVRVSPVPRHGEFHPPERTVRRNWDSRMRQLI
ncbi:hypothetical protein ABTJ92_21005, partial [Acinetobacter baumannii]